MSAPFKITGKKGFRLTFPNGYAISVQFGPGNYGSNYDMRIRDDDEEAGKRGATEVETAIIDPSNNLIQDPKEGEDADTVQGYQTMEQVMDRIMRIYALPPSAAQEGKP